MLWCCWMKPEAPIPSDGAEVVKSRARLLCLPMISTVPTRHETGNRGDRLIRGRAVVEACQVGICSDRREAWGLVVTAGRTGCRRNVRVAGKKKR
ncbi:hypothetical protein L1887_07739 [Cichorium endivia]|nr:hypothetical protein L1887_07739 [Cichorium endivia]